MGKQYRIKFQFSSDFLFLHVPNRISHKEFPKLVKTKECPSCAMEVDSSSKICPICQFEFPRRAPWITWMAIFLLLVWLLSYLI
jgi:hypothetical protein